jgi:hypothetical protein
MFQFVRGLLLIGWKLRRPEVKWPNGSFERIKASVLAECGSFEPPC